MKSLTRTALIVGAGIGGLSAGLALRQAGWTIRIFERAASPRELGFGLGLAPNAIAALRTLGVADVVLSRGFEPRRAELRRLDGTVLKRAELPPEALGGPMIVTLRPALHGALLEAVGMDAITLESDVTGFTATGTRVTLQMAGGEVAEGDVLIGADGVGPSSDMRCIRRKGHPGRAESWRCAARCMAPCVIWAISTRSTTSVAAWSPCSFAPANRYLLVPLDGTRAGAARHAGSESDPGAHVAAIRFHVSRGDVSDRRSAL